MAETRLLPADPSSCGPVSLRGFLENSGPEIGIEGWAADLSNPERALVVELCAGDAVVASAPANRHRDDVRWLGLGRHQVGFRFEPRELRARIAEQGVAGDARLSVKVAGTDFSLRSAKPLPPPSEFMAPPGDAAGPSAPDLNGNPEQGRPADAAARDLPLALRTIATGAAASLRAGPVPGSGEVAGLIECLFTGDGDVLRVFGWMEADSPLHAPVVVVADGVEHPSALIAAAYARDDVPAGAQGIVGLLKTGWRLDDRAAGGVRFVLLGGAPGAHLRLVEKPTLFTAAGCAAWTEERQHLFRGAFAEPLRRMLAPAAADSTAPDGFADLMRRGSALRAAGEHRAALDLLQAALALEPRDAWARLSVAGVLGDLGRHDEAEAACRAVLADEPDNAGAMLSLGHSLRRRGDAAGALPLFRAALALRPRDPWARLSVADALADLGGHDEAEENCRALLADEPDNAGAMLSLGHSLRRRGDMAGALPLFRAALALKPRDPWARLSAAETLADLGRHEEAEEICRTLLADEGENAGALMSLGRVARAKADLSAAAAWLERAARAAPDAPAPRLALADALRDLGHFAAAAEAARVVLSREPGRAEAWMSLGHTERRAGRRDAALRAFARASELKPDSPGPLVQMAVEERRLGRPENCERLLNLSLELDNGCGEALEQFGEHLHLAGDLDRALAMFRRAIASQRPTPWAYMAASQVLVELGELDAALRTLADAAARLGDRPEVAAKRVELLRRTGDWPAASAAAEEAARAWPRHFGIWYERARLEQIRGGPDAIAAHLPEAPAGNTHEQARVHHLRGLHLSERWRFDEAQEHHARAIELNPDDGWPRFCLAQARLLALDTEGAREQLRAASPLGASAAKLQGRSTNISQTHLGQMLDEFTLDRQALDELRALRGLPPGERVEPLLALVRRFPDYTPAALGLLLALRQSGRLSRRPPPDAPEAGAARTAPPIPRTFAQYWDDAAIPSDLGKLMGSWGKLYPGFALRRFSHEAARAFLARFHAAEVQAAYRRAREPAQKADIFRLAYLWSEGGWYADADDRLVGDFEALRVPGARLVLYQEDLGTIGNNFIGAAPGHPLVGRALRLAVEAVNRGDSDILWLSTGPGLLTRAFAGLLADPGREPLAALDDAVVLEHGELQRTVAIHCLVGYKNTERHWSRTAFGRRAKAAGGSGGAKALPAAEEAREARRSG